MAKNIIIFLICLLIPSFASGGTWEDKGYISWQSVSSNITVPPQGGFIIK